LSHNFKIGMSVIYILLSISIAVAVVFFIAFVYAVKKGQFDDSYTPSVRMLFEDELVKEHTKPTVKTKKTN
jgi:cbb3-type cytochrome oxidase maturation protein